MMKSEEICCYRKLRIKKHVVHLELETEVPEDRILAVVLREQGEGNDVQRFYFEPCKKTRKRKTVLQVQIDLQSVSLNKAEWNITLLVEKDAKEKEIICLVDKAYKRIQFYLRDKTLKYVTPDDEIYFLLLIHTQEVVLVRREHKPFDDQP